MNTVTRSVPSPIGDLLLVGDGETLHGIYLADHPRPDGAVDDGGAFSEAVRQLEEFFAGKRTAFELPLAPAGTDFQRRVWDVLRQIPFGETVSYGEVAKRAGYPGSARAVGAAVGRNPVAIVVPCHRVIGSDGSLTGYAGGLDRKVSLLDHERAVAGGVDRAS
jgi:methylated-DNA-[protein]-cysteine S-methyltransferase